jgi:hypothetical protein
MKRYNQDEVAGGCDMLEDPKGEWVKFEDFNFFEYDAMLLEKTATNFHLYCNIEDSACITATKRILRHIAKEKKDLLKSKPYENTH